MIGYTIGGLILWPASRIDGMWTINQARGCLGSKIGDRMDLTLECIRRHYRGETSPLGDPQAGCGDVLARYAPFDDFTTRAIPQDLDTYLEYRRRSIEFIQARNTRIDQLKIDSG